MVQKKQLFIVLLLIWFCVWAEEDLDFYEDEVELESSTEIIRQMPQINKDDVVNYLVQDRNNMTTSEPLYTTPYHNQVKINNIWLKKTMLPYQQYTFRLNNWGEVNDNIFQNSYYPYKVTTTRIYAGTGDYDNNFAHVTVLKDHFITIPGLNFRGDFKGKNENIELFDHRTSDFYLQLDYIINSFKVSTTYINTNKKTLTKNMLINNSYISSNDVNLYWQYTNFEVSWMNLFASYYKSDEIISSTNNQRLASDEAGINLGYNINNFLIVASTSSDFKSAPDIEFQSENQWQQTNFILFDNYSKIYATQFTKWKLSNYFSLLTDLRYIDRLQDENYFLVKNHIDRVLSGGVGFNLKNYVEIDILVGDKKITQYFNPNYNDSPYKTTHNFTTSQLTFNAALSLYDFTLNIHNYLQYDAIPDLDQVYLLPKFYNVLDPSLTWFLNNNNFMSIGARLSLMTSILNENGNNVKSNPVLDTYFSIGITKLFDIKLELNNIYQNTHFGNNALNDFNVTAYLVWYLLN